jgi:putative flippase GtrA
MSARAHEVVRYVLNGVLATAVHYGVLMLNIEVFGFRSAGMANAVAALFGISASFLGSRYFVFQHTVGSFHRQALGFGLLYGATAALHGLCLWLWTDRHGLDYRAGFVIVTAMQMALSYVGNKFLIFKS